MTLTKEKVFNWIFPEGNMWFAWLYLLWFLGISIIEMIIPASLSLIRQSILTNNSVIINQGLLDLAMNLWNFQWELLKFSGIFIAISVIIDLYHILRNNKQKRLARSLPHPELV